MSPQGSYHPAAFLLQSLIAQSNAVERELARLLGLNATDYRALSVLIQLGRDTTVTMGVLAGALGTTPATSSAIVERLERGGYAVRSRAQTDRRQVMLEATPLGWRRIADIMRPLMETSNNHLRSLSAADATVVTDFLTATVRHLVSHTEMLATRQAEE